MVRKVANIKRTSSTVMACLLYELLPRLLLSRAGTFYKAFAMPKLTVMKLFARLIHKRLRKFALQNAVANHIIPGDELCNRQIVVMCNGNLCERRVTLWPEITRATLSMS